MRSRRRSPDSSRCSCDRASRPQVRDPTRSIFDALAKADVDAVLTGTILRAERSAAGDRAARGRAQRHGEVVADDAGVHLGNIFQLQDALTGRIVESLAVPLTARDKQALARDVPASAKAYEFYLRANQLAYQARNWTVARDLYRQCLEVDPNYAPAWARLARIYRLIGMYSGDVTGDPYALAEEAFQRALAINPDLSIAHNLYTVVELETGRARQAMLRLLDRTRRRSSDPELFAGLVQACRYAGLQRPAIVAHEHAVRLEPQIKTGVCPRVPGRLASTRRRWRTTMMTRPSSPHWRWT